MKKLISILMVFVMLTTALSGFAAEKDASRMQEVLVKVKDKITVPAELSEFSGNVSEYNNKLTYDFNWNNDDYSKYMSVICDSEGRITSLYDGSVQYSDKYISSVSKKDIIAYAESFIKKVLPEAFEGENDGLFYDESSYSLSGNLRYNLEFRRLKNSVPVKDNSAYITLCINDDEIYVRSLNVSFNYDAGFSSEGEAIENYTQKYMEKFPVEMVYANEYNPLAKGNEPRNVPKLIYRIKDDNIGYIDITTGEVITEDAIEDDLYLKESGSAADSTTNSLMSGGGSLTEQEIAELDTIEGLMSAEEIETKLKKLPYINLSNELTLNSKELYKDSLGDYFYRLSYSSDKNNVYRYFGANVNAKNGEIIRINCNDGSYDSTKSELTESEVKLAEKKISEFLKAVCSDKLSETVMERKDNYSSYVNQNYVRTVNGIKYIDNGISISFDAKNNCVRSYNLNFTKAEFTDPSSAINAGDAYSVILEYSPTNPVYIHSGGNYKLAVSLTKRSVKLDAVTGEIKDAANAEEYSYSDINGHWVQEAAEKLAEIQIGINGGALEPEKEITQEEFFRLMCSGILGKYYNQCTSDELYKMLIADKILSEDEKSPDAFISREVSFQYIIRLAGYEKLAQISDIYKISYADSELLTEGKIGYAAILSGLGIICGNGGYLRPVDTLTRAEAITMLYKYLLSI